MPVPYTFGSATASIPLSQLDSNFATAITIGNTAVQLGNTVTTLNNMTLANVTISSGNVTITNVSVTTANVSGTANVQTLAVTQNATVAGNVTVTGNVSMNVATITTSNVTTENVSSLIVTGNQTFVGTGNRITGLINGTVASRLAIQTSTTNASTGLYILPNGTGTVAELRVSGESDPTNASTGALSIVNGTDVRLQSFISGTGTYLPMTFYTGGSERMRVDTSGNVGIGQTSQVWDEKLGVRLATSGSGTVGLGVYSGSTTYASSMIRVQAETGGSGWKMYEGRANGGSQLFWVDGSGGAYFAGNVGIGTSSPSYKLDILTGGGGVYAAQFGNGTAAQGMRIVTGMDSTSSGITTGGGTRLIQFDGTNNVTQFYTNGSERMRIDSSGNVGIGTTSPNDKVQVSSASDLNINVTQTTVALTARYGCDGSGAIMGVTGNSNTRFVTNNTERMRIDSSGNLLVGTTTTSGYGNGGGGVLITSSSATNANNYFKATSTSYAESLVIFDSQTTAGTGYNFLYARAGSGGVAQFKVSGNGIIYAQNTTVQSISDVRLKENIKNSDEGLNVITALRPVRYDWKEGYGNDRKNQLGFIAQEVEGVFPDAVSEWQGINDSDDTVYKTVGPASLIPVLVKAIQEQQALIQQLQADIATLKGQK